MRRFSVCVRHRFLLTPITVRLFYDHRRDRSCFCFNIVFPTFISTYFSLRQIILKPGLPKSTRLLVCEQENKNSTAVYWWMRTIILLNFTTSYYSRPITQEKKIRVRKFPNDSRVQSIPTLIRIESLTIAIKFVL